MFFRFMFFLLLITKIVFAATDEIEFTDLSHRTYLIMPVQEETKPQYTSDLFSQREITVSMRHNHTNLSSPMEPEEHVKRWLDAEVINKKEPLSNATNNALFIFGTVSSLARGSVYFILGYNLSEAFLVNSIHNPGHYVISAIYASAASIPMTILGTKSSHKFLKYLITPTSQNFIKVKREESCGKRIVNVSKTIILGGAAACSASILTSIAYYSFNDIMGWYWLVPGIPTFYVRTLIDYYAIMQLGEAAYGLFISEPKNKKISEVKPNAREAHIHSIKESLKKSRNFIKALNFNQAKIIETIIKDPEKELHQKIKAFIRPELFLSDNEEVILKKSNYCREWMGYMGGIVAVCGMYLYYEGTRDGFGFMQPLFNLTDQETRNAQISLAVISLVTASSLSAIAAHSSTLKFYDWISNLSTRSCNTIYSLVGGQKNEIANTSPSTLSKEDISLKRKRIGIACFAFLLASCDASTLYQVAVLQSLSMHNVANVFALVSSCLSLFTMSFWAVDEGLMNYLRGGDPKATTLTIIDNIDKTLPSMSDLALKALSQTFEETRSVL